MNEEMGFEELQQIVSVCLDQIESLKSQNTEYVELFKHFERRINEVEQQVSLINNRYYMMKCSDTYLKNREKLQKAYNGSNAPHVTPFEGRGVVYSAITGNYDQVREIKYKNPDLDYILFTDNPNIKSNTWDVRLLDNPEKLDAVRLARRVKILGHEYLGDYDYSIWTDAKLELIGDLDEYVKKYRDTRPVLCFAHYFNDCIYQEEFTCEQLHKDNVDIMRKQIQRYRKEGYPDHNGLVETAILVRELKNDLVRDVMNTWWQEVKNYSYRDQLSFNYSCWKHDFLFDMTDLFIYYNEYVSLHAHNS